ncbi:uncharacterized protein L3040_003822 [Drepanopeziza brunnea f. sp. 'multigermtubi']|uniref:Uncharacterized protein n=1 Tax=Marssonina brunnea f. sp. multigermtubi (strain MB_m1) TaxID=1072389 RepID=K1WPR9_MARBU|nr:uncharacterized protein MBM_06742 [Drepanopeziza brunnea f. sp. 'multigermtubi' MB_m1]EKD14981.1 hypothetical protein MBM_06742 [Drepanopeziza brunnea f. sp. 'multigermtubi' MB_m1]KAJ5046583.1 hypothetical protein L3040_003822 [Drepanopeziza brunnea f. sp. 'multigermtubi']
MLLSRSLCVALLASFSFLFDGAQGRKIIGYRTVDEEEADLINFFNKPYRDTLYDRSRRYYRQIGNGFYMVNEPAGWLRKRWDWYCVIEAEIDKIEKAAKVYIPEYYGRTTRKGRTKQTLLWESPEEVFVDYIDSLDIPEPDEALRFSWIVEHSWKMQMVIPTKVLNRDDLGLWAKCYQTRQELLDYSNEVVEWGTWGIEGNPGLPRRMSK